MLRLLSLFSGSGGFELAGAMCGITPVAASEVEPYPIAVTKSRFPNMKHLGDISKINGAEIEPVDIITFGSPCQDMSVAGKRAGLKHEDNGDEETTRSGHKGVWFETKRQQYQAFIQVHGTRIHLGRFAKYEDAVKARIEAEEKYFAPLIKQKGEN